MNDNIHNVKQSSQGRNWYAIQTNPGYENAVLKNLRNAIESWGVEDYIFNVVVPTKKVLKIVRGKQKEVEEKIYPGYVLVDMIVNDKTWWIVRNTPRVSGFLGTGSNPVPVSETEMASILDQISKEESDVVTEIEVNDRVIVTDGAFKDTDGVVVSIDKEKKTAKVKLEFFGRETEVELGLAQIKKK